MQRSPSSATAPALLYHLHPCRRPALRLRNATPGVRRQSIPGLASNWAQSIAPTVRAIPPSRCRCIGAPTTAHRAQPGRSTCPQALALLIAHALARTMRASRGPSIAARLRRNCPKDGPQEVGQFDASPGADCRRTPEQAREPEAQGPCVGREWGGGLLFAYFLLATQEKVRRSPWMASGKRQDVSPR